ncbi:unnamed protein product [Vitrella brassicaformis CCMP3155]|uniref:Uncharacterized protein n=3 Tax=Vitrella brassicaformis TaxID=1169539 RepID=A0A0G4GCX1_VITBC|nr:unnamed protein product [Vitrella brassicaformis CCMP3155]|eukprot:CEM27130.1 unnamed protein product [Vitrella brassicaformis CCMP3155]
MTMLPSVRCPGVSSHRSLAATLPTGHGGLQLAGEDPCLMPDNWQKRWKKIIGGEVMLEIYRREMTKPPGLTRKTLKFEWLEPGEKIAEPPLFQVNTDLPASKGVGREAVCSIHYWVQLIKWFSPLSTSTSLREYGYCGQQGDRVCACVSMPGESFKQCKPLEGEPTAEQDNEATKLGRKLASLLPPAGGDKKGMGQQCTKDDDCYTPHLVAEYQKPGIKCFKAEKNAADGICKLEAAEGEVCDRTHECGPRLGCFKKLWLSGSQRTFGTGTCKKI